jgi:hypothetical protein
MDIKELKQKIEQGKLIIASPGVSDENIFRFTESELREILVGVLEEAWKEGDRNRWIAESGRIEKTRSLAVYRKLVVNQLFKKE